MTEALKKIVYNCKQATFLIEKRTSGKITASEALKLQIHLTGCSICRTYQKQSMLINSLFASFQPDELRLNDDFKAKLQWQIEKEMNKN